jgi:hypothetical protein
MIKIRAMVRVLVMVKVRVTIKFRVSVMVTVRASVGVWITFELMGVLLISCKVPRRGGEGLTIEPLPLLGLGLGLWLVPGLGFFEESLERRGELGAINPFSQINVAFILTLPPLGVNFNALDIMFLIT